MGGYFFCCDSMTITNVAKEIIKVKDSNTVILITPFHLKGSELPPMKALSHVL